MTAARGSGSALSSLRAAHSAAILALLREDGPLHRAELARRLGLSRSAVSIIVSDLVTRELVVASDREPRARQAARGRPGDLLTLNPAAGVAVGVDFSYTHMRAVVADLSHTVLADHVEPFAGVRGAAEGLALASRAVRALLAQTGVTRDRVLGVGLGVPGPVDQRSAEVASSSNSLSWAGIKAGEELAADLGVPVQMDNTSHLGCLAEVMWGSAAGYENVLYLKLSTGIGAGLTFHGRTYRGAVGAAGEIGHITVDESGPACRCGNRGCVETYASVPAVLAALAPVLGPDVTLGEVMAGAAAGYRPVCRVLADVGRIVGTTLAGVLNLLNPQRVVIGGDLAAAGDVLLDPMRDAVLRHGLQITVSTTDIVLGQLGDQAGALGGVALVLRHCDAVRAGDRDRRVAAG